MNVDRSNEMLSGIELINAFEKCFNCENLKPCDKNDWAITCDKDGVTCDNYKPLSEPPKED